MSFVGSGASPNEKQLSPLALAVLTSDDGVNSILRNRRETACLLRCMSLLLARPGLSFAPGASLLFDSRADLQRKRANSRQ
jgi:hypothetical protein